MTPDDKAQLLFWGILTFLFLLAFRRWANNPPVTPPAPSVSEVYTHATQYNFDHESALPRIMGEMGVTDGAA